MKHDNVVGFLPDFTGFPEETCQALNQRLAKALRGFRPYSDNWFLLAKEFHDRIDHLRKARNVSPQKLSLQKLNDILDGLTIF